MWTIITYGPFHREVNYLYVNIGGRRRLHININDMSPPPSLIVDSGDSHFYVNPARKLVPRNLQCDIVIQLSRSLFIARLHKISMSLRYLVCESTAKLTGGSNRERHDYQNYKIRATGVRT